MYSKFDILRLEYYFSVFVFFYYSVLVSQTVEPSCVVERDLLQIEMGLDYAMQQNGNENQLAWSLPSVLCRYGAFSNMELQFSVPLVKEQLFEENYKINDISHIENIQIGTAINLWKQHKALPELELMLRVCIPFKKVEGYNAMGKTIALNFSNVFLEKWSLNCNIGYAYAVDGNKTGYHVLNLSYNLNDRFHFFVENFSEFCATAASTQNLNMGGGFMLCKNMCFDFSVAKGLNYNLYYTSALLTWVVDTKQKRS